MEIYENRIRALREDRDLRQMDVSIATGIDQKTLSNYETGKTNPDSYSIIRLAEFFGVSTDYLLGYSKFSIKSNGDIASRLEKIETELRELKTSLLKRDR